MSAIYECHWFSAKEEMIIGLGISSFTNVRRNSVKKENHVSKAWEKVSTMG